MTSIVKLNKDDLETIIDILEDVVLWKSHVLKPKSWETFETNWLPSILLQIKDNEFKVNRSHANTFQWLRDQIYHCRKLSPGVDPKYAVPLEQTRKGIRAITICQTASKGQLYYDSSRKKTNYQELFKEIK